MQQLERARARLTPYTKADIAGSGVVKLSQDLRMVTAIDVKPAEDLGPILSYDHLPESDDGRPKLAFCVDPGVASCGGDERNYADQEQQTSESD